MLEFLQTAVMTEHEILLCACTVQATCGFCDSIHVCLNIFDFYNFYTCIFSKTQSVVFCEHSDDFQHYRGVTCKNVCCKLVCRFDVLTASLS